tara:strand:+ start:559 stop:822 length:264 start_codon:yes stop_codon:yes gene_type:complete
MTPSTYLELRASRAPMQVTSGLSDTEATRKVGCLKREMQSVMDWHDSGVLGEEDRKLLIQAMQSITEELVQVMTTRPMKAIGGVAFV